MLLKKLFIVAMIAVLTLSAFSASSAQFTDEISDEYNEAVNRLSGLGIMTGYEDDSFKEHKEVTRAEFVVMIMRLLAMDNLMVEGEKFKDVPAEHWASSSINMALDMGIVNGVGNDMFAPDDGVEFEQALKIMVEVLGYGIAAESKGGYPEGYISVAINKGLLKETNARIGEKMTRGEVALLISAALDVPVLEEVIGLGGRFEVSDNSENTLYKKMLNRSELVNVKGVVTANSTTSVDGSDYLKEEYVRIGDNVYKAGDTNIYDYLGYSVDAYIAEDDVNTVVSCSLLSRKNETLKIDAEDINVEATTLDTISYKVNNKTRTEDISKAVFIFNGKYEARSNLTKEDIIIYNGELTLVDNGGGNGIDVVFVTERESFVVERIAPTAETVYFKSGYDFRGREGFKIATDDDDKEYKIYNKEGNEIKLSEIEKNNIVTLEVSRDNSYGKIYVSDDVVTGKVIEMDSDNGIISVDGDEYKLAKNTDGTLAYSPTNGMEAAFLLDYNGFIVGDDGSRVLQYKYAYVVAAEKGKGIARNTIIKAVIPGKKEKVVEVVNDTENVSYVFKNDNVEILETANTVKYTREDGFEERVAGGEIGSEINNKIIRYRLDNDGKIKELKYFSPYRISRYFNAEILSFGGVYDGDGFVADEATAFIMVPEAITPEDDDFLVEVEVADKARINLVPIMVDEETQAAEAIMVYATMDANTPKPFKDTTAISIVGKVINKKDENDEWGSYLSVLNKDKLEYAFVGESEWQNSVVSGLIKGDLIRYNKNSDGEIDNIEKIETIQGLENYYFRSNANSPNEKVFGIVQRADLHRLVNVYNEYMDIITVDYSDGTATYYIPRKDGPEFYLYNRESGDISVATADDIISSDVAGDDATKIFMLVNNNEVMVAVLIMN